MKYFVFVICMLICLVLADYSLFTHQYPFLFNPTPCPINAWYLNSKSDNAIIMLFVHPFLHRTKELPARLHLDVNQCLPLPSSVSVSSAKVSSPYVSSISMLSSTSLSSSPSRPGKELYGM